MDAGLPSLQSRVRTRVSPNSNPGDLGLRLGGPNYGVSARVRIGVGVGLELE